MPIDLVGLLCYPCRNTLKEDEPMAKIYKGSLELIGNTPLVEVVNIEKELGLEATLLVKL